MYICKLYALLIWKTFDIFYANFFELHIRIIEFLLLKDDNIFINIFLYNLKLYFYSPFISLKLFKGKCEYLQLLFVLLQKTFGNNHMEWLNFKLVMLSSFLLRAFH